MRLPFSGSFTQDSNGTFRMSIVEFTPAGVGTWELTAHGQDGPPVTLSGAVGILACPLAEAAAEGTDPLKK